MADKVSEASGKLKRLQAEMRTLINEDAVAEQEPELNWAQRFAHFWILVVRNFLKNRCLVRASALAYTTLLALVPLLAVSISVASLFLPRDEAKQKAALQEWIDSGISHAAPALGLASAKGGQESPFTEFDDGAADQKQAALDIAGQIVTFVGNIRFGTIGATAMAGLLFVAISLLRTVEASFNDIWGVAKGRTWFMSIVLYWAVITLGPVFVVLAKGANYLHYLPSFSLAQNGWDGTVIGQLLTSLSWIFPLVLMSFAFAALYLWMPNTRVQWQAALVGGLTASTLWTANGHLAAFYNARMITYSKIYGSLGIVPLFLVGMYFSWNILLLGSQTSYVFQHRRAYLQERRAGRVHQQGREFAALRVMTHLGERFLAHEKPATAPFLASKFAIPPKLVLEILQSLIAAKLVVEVSGTEMAYAPARPLANITPRDVLRALRSGQGHDLHTNHDNARPHVRAEFDSILAAEDARASDLTIEDLARRSLASPAAATTA
ncbi:MAG TPA: YhjD/YihY/BrkB family envelope integrity protein [Candidatus Limnocylindria bacterium]|jgi:membrane protein|nr:YhjD/YihY/BrkB family envelope integrity protein [Candidatus Limnocylindria bacterium]